MKPGIYRDITNEAYHAGAGLSNSQLQAFARAPLLYWNRYRNPKRPASDSKSKPGQLEGNLAHCMTLEPDQFFRRYVVGPTASRNTNAWKAFADQALPKIAIQQPQYDAAETQAEAIHSLPEVGPMFDQGYPEVSIYATDPGTGLLLRCRFDWLHYVDESQTNAVIAIDVKTLSDASPAEFSRQIARKGYHLQQAFYSYVAELANLDLRSFIFVGVESEWPHLAGAVALDADSVRVGRQRVQELLEDFAECSAYDRWPAYSTGIEVVSLPRWATAAA